MEPDSFSVPSILRSLIGRRYFLVRMLCSETKRSLTNNVDAPESTIAAVVIVWERPIIVIGTCKCSLIEMGDVIEEKMFILSRLEEI